ncbi:polysaccharide deacetylase family protein [Vallicoccus soli]|uniref:Uncharacterized protein n=1 Tax=Vallicoccus soli TaxID=2339232 RepID=A0A3A3Z345_9ACTN|nr:polysaccharide deacetylase family protein [Vallicoccus soli]RJK97832.1 hypothetical protein D5H78_02315 [Vallicoccus soli]
MTGDLRPGTVPDAATARSLADAVPAEGHERTGVAVHVALHERAGPGAAMGAPAVADGAAVASRLRRWVGLLGGGDDDHAVQAASTSMAWWHVRTHLPGARPPAPPAPGGGGPLVRGDLAAPRPGALGEVLDAFVAGRQLRVVNYHSTPERLAHVVEEEVRDYAARYDVLGPAGLARLLGTGEWPGERPPLVVGLFDGFRNNATVALPALDRAGVTAWLHLPTGFLDAAPEDQPAVAVAHAVRVAPEEVAAGARLAMTWDEVAAAAERHAVGAHTATHTTAAAVADRAAVEREVVRPLARVAEVTGRPADAFAFLGGTPWDPASDAGRAVRDAGAAWWVSGLGYERLARR